MDLAKFKKDFESSGLTQRAYGEKISMSASMVHYYLNKSKPAKDTTAEDKVEKFVPLKINTHTSGQSITITTAQGVEVNIPI